jgi:hypothetical protein
MFCLALRWQRSKKFYTGRLLVRYKRGFKNFRGNAKGILGLFGFLAFVVLFMGCSATKPKQYVRKDASFQNIKKVAVLPFNNLTDDRYAGEKFRNAVVIEVLERGLFDVAEPGEVNKVAQNVFRELGLKEGALVALDVESIQRISERLGVQALLIGTVESYGTSRSTRAPYQTVAVFLNLVEAKSGLTLWKASHSEKGNMFFRTIFGIDQKNEIDLSRDVAKKTLSTLFGKK